MINKAIARRYAQALFDIAKEHNAVEKFGQELKFVIDSINENEDLKNVVYSHLVSAADKKDLMAKLFAGKVDSLVSNFIYLLMDKNRENCLESIGEVFKDLADQDSNIVAAGVKSAVQLSDEQVQNLEGKLSQVTGKNVKVKVEVDKSLIGGISVRIGDVVYDGSVAKQLGMLKEHLQQVQLGR